MQFPSAPEETSFGTFFETLAEAGVEYVGAIGDGGKFTCPNPDHVDEHASFDVHVGRNGKPIFTCSPCRESMGQEEFVGVLRAAGISWSGDPLGNGDEVDWGSGYGGWSPKVKGRKANVELTATYAYNFSDGTPNFRVRRFDPTGDEGRKFFLPARYVRGEGFKAGKGALDEVQRTPYRLEEFADWAEDEKPVYFVEGEKAADALLEKGKAATTFHGGTAGKRGADADWCNWFLGFPEVRIWPDADEAGVRWAQQVGDELKTAGVNVTYWFAPAEDVGPSDDAYDVLERGQRPHNFGTDPEKALEALAALKPVPEAPERASRGPEPILLPDGKQMVSATPSGAGTASGPGERVRPYPVAAGVEPQPFAEEYLKRNYTTEGGVLTLRRADLRWWLWQGTHYVPLEDAEMQARLARDLKGEQETTADGERRPIKVKRTVKAEVLSALQDQTLVSEHGAGTLLPCRGGVPFRNGWLDAESGELLPLTPERDVRWVVPDDYDPEAPAPREWLKFLDSLGWGRDTEEYRLLRQWFGYLLSGDTSMQKALMLIGPKRAGKGTILAVAEALLGDGHVGLDLSAFSTNFGLSPIIGKAVATVGDARFEMRTDKALIRRLLSLIGQDTITIDRKHKDPVSVRAGARLMVGTNELPSMVEASDALASRFLFMRLTRSFYNAEDHDLLDRLRRELPGIVRWALRGLADLQAEGRFSETSAGLELQREMTEISNPIRVFIEEECEFDAQAFSSATDLHNEFAVWAEQRKHYVPDVGVFARDLNAAYPDDVIVRGRKRVGQKAVRGFYGVKL